MTFLLHGQPGEQRVALEDHAPVGARSGRRACRRAASRPPWSSRPARIRASVDLPQPEGPITHKNSRRWAPKLDAIERHHAALCAVERLRQPADLQHHRPLLECVEALRDRRRLLAIARQLRAVAHASTISVEAASSCGLDGGLGALAPAAADQRTKRRATPPRCAPRRHGNRRRPSAASTMSVNKPIRPIRMIDANTLSYARYLAC